CVWKFKTALVTGFRRRNFCMAIWCGRVGNCRDVRSANRLRSLRARVCRLLHRPTFDPTIKFNDANGEERDDAEWPSRDRWPCRSIRDDANVGARFGRRSWKGRSHLQACADSPELVSTYCAPPRRRDGGKPDTLPVVDRDQPNPA